MSTGSRRTTTAAGVILLLMSVVVGLGLPAAATHVAPQLITGNENCAAATGLDEVLRVEPVASGTFPIPGGSITVTVNGSTLDWTSTVSIAAVFVKGGPDGNLYVYGSGATGDTGLHSPTNPSNGQFYGLSHITFCVPDQPTTTTTQGTTTTTQGTTTTTQGTTTTTQGTTTTTQGTTTTTQGTGTTQQGSTTTSTSLPFDSVPDAAVVGGIQVSAPAPAQVATQETLPFTGVSTGSMAMLAVALAGAGVLLLAASRQSEEKSAVRSWN